MTSGKGFGMTRKVGSFHNSPGPVKSYFTGLAPLILSLRSGHALRGELAASHYSGVWNWGGRLPRRLRLLAMTERRARFITPPPADARGSGGPSPSDPFGKLRAGTSTSLRTGLNKATVRHEAEASHYIRNSPSPSYLKRGNGWHARGELSAGGRALVDGGAGM